MRLLRFASSLCLLLLFTSLVLSQGRRGQQGPPGAGGNPEAPGRFDPANAMFGGLRLRSIGPAVTSGRVIDFAVDPNDRTKYFVAVASGGVWKTVNSGTTWTPVFDNYGAFSIGDVTLDPKDPNVVWVGTGERNSQRSVGYGDGVYKSEDGGKNWRKVDKVEGVPENSYVHRVLASQHDTNTVFAVYNNHQNGDFKPYLMKSTDAGKTWTSINGNLPERGSTYAIAEDHVNPNLLFCGTEFGLFFTTDGGAKWTQLKGGLPTIAVRDLAIHKRANDLVVATFGRGFYVLDDYTPLRNLKADTLAQESNLFPVSDALMYIRSSMAVGSQGASYYLAPNPAYGATITYFTKEAPKTKRQKRQEAERAAAQKNETPPYPSRQQLREEAEEEPPAIILTITDAEGRVVRRLSVPATPGVQRVTWDFRYAPPVIQQPAQLPPGFEGIDLGGGGFGGFGPQGVLAMPSKYTVTIARKIDGVVTQLPGSQTFNVIAEGTEGMSAADRNALAEFQRKVSNLQRAVTGASDVATNANTRIGLMRRAAQEAPGSTPALMNEVKALDSKIDDIMHALRGGRDNTDIPPPSINQRVNTIAGRIRLSAIRPTQSQIENYNIAAEEFKPVLARLKTLTEVEIPKLEKALDAAGAPWTPGRLPEWTDK